MSERDKQIEFNELLLLAIEGGISQDQAESLNRHILERPDAAGDYLDFIRLYGELSPYGDAGRIRPAAEEENAQAGQFDQLLHVLAQEENTAPTICGQTADVPESLPELIQNVRRQKIAYKMSRSSAMMLAVALAASFFIVVTLRISPPVQIEVATISDSLDAVYAGNRSFPIGMRLTGSPESIWLQKGIVKIAFDYGAEVVIESPAEFTLKTGDDMTLHSGRLFAHVPGRSKGFRVDTPNASVIDLGTEFAIKVDYDGSSDVHLFVGKASLIPGTKGKTGEGQILTAGQARHVDTASDVQEIPVKRGAFVHDINSLEGLVWRGQTELDLADVVCGGNGFGTGDPDIVIDPATGRFLAYVERGQQARGGASSYLPIESSRYIDGVFVPNGDKGSIVVSSEETLFTDCPPTSGRFRKDITVLRKVYDQEGGTKAVGDVVYGYPEQPAIWMHANMGITFDLAAIRNSMLRVDLDFFEALCAIAVSQETAPAQLGKADFWILVDGQVRRHIEGAPVGFSEKVRIPIEPTDRFLTLMTTDHMQTRESDPIHSDRCFFGRPVVGLSVKN